MCSEYRLLDRQLDTAAIAAKKDDDPLDLPEQGSKDHSTRNNPPQAVNITLDAIRTMLQGTVAPPTSSRLPQINLPTFSGKPQEWPEYRALFISLIHEKTQLSELDKMHYLKTTTSGHAAEAIKNYKIIAGEYEPAWSALNDEFNKKQQLLINEAWEMLLSQTPIQVENSALLKKMLTTTRDALHLIRQHPMDFMESLAVFLMTKNLPRESRCLWEFKICSRVDPPCLSEMKSFIESRFHALEASGQSQLGQQHPPKNRSLTGQPRTRTPLKCKLCQDDHHMFACPTYRGMSATDKLKKVKELSLCIACLGTHTQIECPRHFTCHKCGKAHHSSLHDACMASQDPPALALLPPPPTSAIGNDATSQAILSTAEVAVKGPDGRNTILRAIIDPGSMDSYISENAVKLLHLPRNYNRSQVSGIGLAESQVRGETAITIMSVFDQDTHFDIPAMIMPKVTSDLPNRSFKMLPEFQDLILADPRYYERRGIDLLLGTSVCKKILMAEKPILGTLAALKTHLGWILFGDHIPQPNPRHCLVVTRESSDLCSAVQKFWETEEKLPNDPETVPEEIICEEFFKNTTSRGADGRYVCRLPFKNNVSLGRSRHVALGCLTQLEKRFRSNPLLKDRYVSAMKEYFELGHAVPCLLPESSYKSESSYNCYYIPHLAVIKESSSTTKTRVVYNASAKTDNGRSLNDNLMIGPVIQPDVVEKISSFRLHPFVMACDITKMYRQIKIHEDDWPYQRFLWRPDEASPVKEFCLTTVTFGEASAPFTAIRTLKQIAIDCIDQYPIACSILEKYCYVDDLHYGAESPELVQTGMQQLITCLAMAGMELRKWAVNDPDILKTIPMDHRENSDPIKFMGLNWYPIQDEFRFNAMSFNCSPLMTKKELLAEICRIFDPLGWLQPLVFLAKVLMQKSWSSKLDWNSTITPDMFDDWKKITESLSRINELAIPRWLNYRTCGTFELHGFADASAKGYGCVIYLRNRDSNSPPVIVLAKSRVAPLDTITIPRLELKGALLLTTMMEKVSTALAIPVVQFGWLDSKVALCWIKSPSPQR